MKKVLSTILLATLVISVVAVAGVVPVRAATVGTLEVSSTRFTGDSVIYVRLVDPDLNQNPNGYDVATITYTKGTNSTVLYLNESYPNSGEFYAFLRANGSGRTPTNPPYGTTYNNYTLTLVKGDTFTLTYSDQSPVGSTSVTVTYDDYTATSADLSFDRATLEYPMNGFIRVFVKDFDYNYDPTFADSVNLNILFTNPVNGNTTSLILNFTETGANTSVFAMNKTISYYTENSFSSYLLNFKDLLNVSAAIKVSYNNESTPPFRYINFKKFTPSITVPSTFTPRGDLVITVYDPNLDQKSWEAEDLSMFPGTNITVQTDKGVDNATLTAKFVETDVGTGTFKYTIPVEWGSPTNDGKIQLIVGDSKASIKYYALGDPKAQGISSLSTTPAIITSDKTMYSAGSIVKLTLDAPDLNDDVNNLNFFICDLPGSNDTISEIPVKYLGQTIGYMSIKVNGLPARGAANQTLTFIERDVDSGLYVASLNLTKVYNYLNGTLTNGDSVVVSYYDNINKVTKTASFEIGIAAATISLDRSVYPVPLNGSVVVRVTVTDSEANKSPTIIDESDSVTFEVYEYNGNLSMTNSKKFAETDVNTGIFKDSFTLSLNNSKALINGWVKVIYTDPATGKPISATATLRTTDAMISVDKASVKAGDTLTITVRDPDWNFDSNKPEQVTVYTDISGKPTLILDETDKNSGLFTTELTIGNDIKVAPGTKMTFTYKDWSPSYATASAGYPGSPVEYTATAKWITFTGKISIDKDAYGIGSTMTVTVVDPDLNKDIMSAEPAEVILRVEGIADVKITLSEDGTNSDTFTGDFTWEAASFSGTGWTGADKDLIGKTFMVYYRDVADANGNTVYAMATGTIKSWDAVVAFDKLYYDLGEVAVISVTDPDANTKPKQIQTITITVVSDSDPLGQTITATETGSNTGVFEGKIQISDSFATGKVFAKLGDTVTAKYKDEYPADYTATGKAKTFTGTAVVGVPIARPVPTSNQKFVDPTTGAEKTAGVVGQTIMLQATVKNVDAKSRDFTAIFKVKDSAGVTIFISWVTGTLAAGQELTPAVSWTPSAAGSYTVEVLVVKSLAEPTPYSDPLSKTLTVA